MGGRAASERPARPARPRPLRAQPAPAPVLPPLTSERRCVCVGGGGSAPNHRAGVLHPPPLGPGAGDLGESSAGSHLSHGVLTLGGHVSWGWPVERRGWTATSVVSPEKCSVRVCHSPRVISLSALHRLFFKVCLQILFEVRF